MPCYKPVVAFKPRDGGPILFSEKKDCTEIELPCGRCIGCRLRKQDEWATRLVLESKMHKDSHFVTFTYNDDSLPWDNGLHYRDIQKLHYKMRQKFGPFRFFVAGEYGDISRRPHYHALYFGLNLPDLVKCNSVYASTDVFQSESLGKMWPQGFHTIGNVTWSSARYCAAYTVKRVTGDAASEHYKRVHLQTGEIIDVEPEFARMSLRPGLGESWLRKYWPEVYIAHQAIIIDGQKKPIPRYFDKLMEEWRPMISEDSKFARYKEAEKFLADKTRDRLEVRERVCRARTKFFAEGKRNAI